MPEPEPKAIVKAPAKTPRAERPAAPRGLGPARVVDAAIAAVFLALAFFFGLFPNKDTDFWWHLRTGDWIRQNGKVPTTEFFTFAAEGRPWFDLHWGFQVLISLGYQLGGTPLLIVAKSLITAAGVGLIAFVARRRDWPIWAVVLGWLPGLFVLSGRMYIRPETLTFVYIACTFTVIFHWERRPWVAFFLPLIMFLWVNSHALFVFGPILIGLGLIDAALKRGAFGKDRVGWWRSTLIAVALAAVACFLNPYGIRGTFFPLELWSTMRDPVFKNIDELKPLLVLFRQTGGHILPLQIHIVTFFIAGLSFLLPFLWQVAVWIRDSNAEPAPPADGASVKKARKKAKKSPRAPVAEGWRLSVFRLGLFVIFSYLSLQATRNSHQYAAAMGTLTAWNLAEWAAVARRRRIERGWDEPGVEPAAGRMVALATVVVAFGLVASGQFYVWAGEKRTIGIGEEPLWFAHDATKFAGSEGMPDRAITFHNGHAPLYEYYFGPGKKVHSDARLEAMGPEIYAEYSRLQARIADNAPGWITELGAMGDPVVILDNIQPTSTSIMASFLLSRRYRCVWFDPVAAVFVHEKYRDVVDKHTVDFGALHFRGGKDRFSNDPAYESAFTTAYASDAYATALMPGGEDVIKGMILEGLDHARRLRELDPGNINGWKRASILYIARQPSDLMGEPVARFRMAFDPSLDLAACRATYGFRRAVEIQPDDPFTLLLMPTLFQARGMNAEALDFYKRFLMTTYLNDSQRKGQEGAMLQAAKLMANLGDDPKLDWKNLSELETLENALLAKGRATMAADLIERATRPEARSWEKADRLATIRLHLGEPAKAREAWLAVPESSAPRASRMARVGITYLVEENFDAARTAFAEALKIDPALFEAAYGLAVTEQDAGKAVESSVAARAAIRSATTDHARSAARSVLSTVSPYVGTAIAD